MSDKGLEKLYEKYYLDYIQLFLNQFICSCTVSWENIDNLYMNNFFIFSTIHVTSHSVEISVFWKYYLHCLEFIISFYYGILIQIKV